MNVKMTFTIPHEIAQRLKDAVAERRRSAFVATALGQKLEEVQEKRIRESLIQGYIERYDEDKRINEEWELATIESWDDHGP